MMIILIFFLKIVIVMMVNTSNMYIIILYDQRMFTSRTQKPLYMQFNTDQPILNGKCILL